MNLQQALQSFAKSHSKMDGFMLIQGMYGMGKTQVSQALLPDLIAEHHSTEAAPILPSEVHIITVHMTTATPDEVAGFPMPAKDEHGNKVTVRTMPELFTAITNATLAGAKRVVVVVDELLQTEEYMQIAMTQFLRERRINNYSADPSIVSVLALSNREGDGCAVNTMPNHTLDGACALVCEPNVSNWCEWALGADVHPLIVGWVNVSDNAIDTQPPATEMTKVCTFRGLTRASRMLALEADGLENVQAAVKSDTGYLNQLVEGLIGPRATTALFTHIALSHDMVSWEELCANPRAAGVISGKDSIARAYAYISMLVNVATASKDWHAEDVEDAGSVIIKFLEHSIPDVLKVAFAKRVLSENPAIINNKDWAGFIAEHSLEIRETSL